LKKDGCLISEYLPGTKIINSNFIQRDRLQSAFSEFVVIIETKIDGGTMHTYNYAKEQKKIVSVFNFKDNLSMLPTGNEHLINVEKVFSFNNEEDLLNHLKSQLKNNQNVTTQGNLF
jgi:DNA processing protein